MTLENTLQNLNIKVYLDGADLDSIKKYSSMNVIHGFTSNPSLMSQSNVSNYKDFIISTLSLINQKPISFEVVEDDIELMIEQAKRIASFGKNIYVKIPIVNTKGVSSIPAIKELSALGIPLKMKELELQKEYGKSQESAMRSFLAGAKNRFRLSGIDMSGGKGGPGFGFARNVGNFSSNYTGNPASSKIINDLCVALCNMFATSIISVINVD